MLINDDASNGAVSVTEASLVVDAFTAADMADPPPAFIAALQPTRVLTVTGLDKSVLVVDDTPLETVYARDITDTAGTTGMSS